MRRKRGPIEHYDRWRGVYMRAMRRFLRGTVVAGPESCVEGSLIVRSPGRLVTRAYTRMGRAYTAYRRARQARRHGSQAQECAPASAAATANGSAFRGRVWFPPAEEVSVSVIITHVDPFLLAVPPSDPGEN